MRITKEEAERLLKVIAFDVDIVFKMIDDNDTEDLELFIRKIKEKTQKLIGQLELL